MAAVRAPSDLELPLPAQLDAVWPALTPDGAQSLARELLAAVREAKEKDDLRPVQEVIEAWYRSLLFIQKHGSEGALLKEVEKEEEGDADLLSLEQVRAELGL